jgi:2-polyprenyl-6-hydroxyphenyl methylase/3-demethylubiquinone-9 3-methyltransferase
MLRSSRCLLRTITPTVRRTLATTVDQKEVDKFDAHARANEWWNPDGPLKTLHQINPFRIQYLRKALVNHYNLDPNSRQPLLNVKALDVGCGGGLVAESLTRLGAQVTALDASYNNIQIANQHKKISFQGTPQFDRLSYMHSTAEKLAFEIEQNKDALFDVVVSFEVVEHVSDVPMFLHSLSRLAKPGGAIMLSTLNRTLRSYLLAIVAAEHVLNIVPRGTHEWQKFLAPSEIAALLAKEGVQVKQATGVDYNPLTEKFTLTDDLGVNYMLFAIKNE